MTSIPLHAKVACADGACGELLAVIVDPPSRQVTHFVVADQSFPRSVQRLVPTGQVAETTHDLVRLRCTEDALGQMEPFAGRELVAIEKPSPGEADTPLEEQPEAASGAGVFMSVEVERIPEGELIVRRGIQIEATDGVVGVVDGLLVEAGSWNVTHLALQQGHLWRKREIAIPLSAVDSAQEDTIHVTLSKWDIEQLPAIGSRR
jgi:hypothetical protein